jgi:hypothetical protein
MWASPTRLDWGAVAIVLAVTLVDGYLTAPWATIGFRVRPITLGAAALIGVASAVRPAGLPTGPVHVVPMVVLAAGILIAVQVMRGSRASIGEPVVLEFPLRDGLYCVAQGGPAATNGHARNPAQRHAYDLVMLSGGLTRRCRGLLPRQLGRYEIFGRPIYSPCDGIVEATVDSVPDLAPPERSADAPAGNHVLIGRGDATVVVAHLGLGTVAVKVGQALQVGDLLGRVGNSGNTSEPHLHLHVVRGGVPGRFNTGTGVPIMFVDAAPRPLRRNDRIEVRPAPAPN